MRKLVSILCLIAAASCLFMISCGEGFQPEVHFTFKTTGGAGEYNGSINEFVVGKRFYSAITIRLTEDALFHNYYKVVVEVPKTKEIELENHGGMGSDSKPQWDSKNQLTRFTYTIKGHTKALEEKILFHGTPIGEGKAIMRVIIYDEDGNQMREPDFREIFFKYDIN